MNKPDHCPTCKSKDLEQLEPVKIKSEYLHIRCKHCGLVFNLAKYS